MNQFKNLEIWKRSLKLSTDVYKVTQLFPREEKYGLISQLRRCVVSVSSNIAEGAGRRSKKEFNHFLDISYGSLCELETQMIIAKNLDFLAPDKFEDLSQEIKELQKMTYSFSKKLSST